MVLTVQSSLRSYCVSKGPSWLSLRETEVSRVELTSSFPLFSFQRSPLPIPGGRQ
jgi:hypothetical protein